VADPAAPSLLSRVPLGEFGSWSESIYDEKAAGFFPDRGLALVPYETWGTDGWKSATAVIEVGASALTYRSSILHEFTARRAALSGNHILSISGQELVVENAQDFSKLIPVTQLSLAWQVDRVVPFGPDHIIQIEDGSANTGYFGWFAIRLAFAAESRSTMLRISKASSPDDLIEEVDMGPGKIIGTAVRDGKLYAGQFVNGKDGGKNLIRTWVFDCSNPPELPELGHVDTLLDDSAIRLNLANAAPLWPSSSTLIWHIPAYAFSYYGPIAIDGPVAGPVALPAIQFSTTAQANGLVVSNTAPSPASTSTKSEKMSLPAIYPWYGESSNVTALLCPIRISQPDKPIALPLVTVQGKDGSAARNSRGQAFASGGFVFTSYQEDASGSGKDSSSNRRRAWLQVFDARDSGAIITRDRVSVPGELIGTSDVDERGALLLTTDSNSKTIQACAYDGATAYQVDAWTGSDEGATLSVSPSGRVYVARTWDRPQISSIAFDAASGRFKPGSKLSLSQPIYDLYACDDMLFVSGSALLSAIPAGPSGTLGTARTIDVSANLWVNIGRTSYVPGTGAWFPAGAYGVEFLSLKSNSR
jgi:hypothetical protein